MNEDTFPPQLLKKLLSGTVKHPNYEETRQMARRLTIHADGGYPAPLIDERRPSESEEIKTYRRKIYKSITQNPISKVINSLAKIRRSQDWTIQYDKDNIPKTIREDSTLEKYCEYDYPVYSSVTNWVFSELLKRYLLDANAIVAVLPDSVNIPANEFLQPVARIFSSEQVYDYVEGEYCFLLSDETVRYYSAAGRNFYNDGKVFYLITPETVTRFSQTARTSEFGEEWSYRHGLGYLPITRVGGVFLKSKSNDVIYESRIAGMAPHLDEAVREYSDLQAEVVQHIHSEKYAYTNTECSHCRGAGYVQEPDPEDPSRPSRKECPVCKGSGMVQAVSPYGIHLVNAAKAGEVQVPTPPIGYIQKQVEIVRIQDERVRQHITDALSAINMEYLSQTPLNQSGTAKEVDRDELNNFVNSVAEDLVAVMDKIYGFINDYRYSVLVPDDGIRKAMLPRINVPERFDILSSDYLMQEIASARAAGANPVLIHTMEVEFAKKKFATNPEVGDKIQAVFELDPLPNKTEDEKMTLLANGGITGKDYIISCNVVPFITRAVEADRDFYKKPLAEKRKILEGFAEEVAEQNSAADEIFREALQGQDQDPQNLQTPTDPGADPERPPREGKSPTE